MTHNGRRSELQGGRTTAPEERNDAKRYIIPDRRRKFRWCDDPVSRDKGRGAHANYSRNTIGEDKAASDCVAQNVVIWAPARRRSSGTA
jgi:hypothetical protein